MAEQPEFEFGGEPCSQAEESSATYQREWREAPQALFLSWSRRQQLAYCAARDDDASLNEASEWWIEFYAERAESYKELMK